VVDYLHYENNIERIEVTAFKEISAAVAGHMSYQPPPYFPYFFRLSPELRKDIIHQYLLEEFKHGNMCQHRHVDGWGNHCCVWEYPEVLIACDNQNSSIFPPPESASCPERWLPALACTCPQLLGEVLVHMLVYTERIDLKYIHTNHKFKIATWFRKLLNAIPEGGGQYAVKYLNFPHISLFNELMMPPAITNPSVQLAIACRSLRKLDMIFHFKKLSRYNDRSDRRASLSVDEVLDHFKLRPLLECKNLQDVFFDGIQGLPSCGGQESGVDTLIELGKWLVKGFLIEHEWRIRVEVGIR
jgi:hypothetical protein